MFEVGKTYEDKYKGEWECIAVSDQFAFMQSSPTGTPYTWTHDGKSYSLGSGYDIKPQPREFWICDFGCVYGHPVHGAIHVREVIE